MNNIDAINEAAEKFYQEKLPQKAFVDKQIAIMIFTEVVESDAAKEYLYAQFQAEQNRSYEDASKYYEEETQAEKPIGNIEDVELTFNKSIQQLMAKVHDDVEGRYNLTAEDLFDIEHILSLNQTPQKQSAGVWIDVKTGKMPEKGKFFCVKTKGVYSSWERYNGKQTDEQFRNVLVDSGVDYWLDETPPKQLSDEDIEKLVEKEYPLMTEEEFYNSPRDFDYMYNDHLSAIVIDRANYIKGFKAALNQCG